MVRFRARRGFALGVCTLLAVPSLVQATNHIVQLNEVGAGVNGDSSVQYVEMKFPFSQNLWGPQGGETESRAMLRFFDARGVQVGTFFFPSNPPDTGPLENGLFSALIATQEFADLTGIQPDFILPDNLIHPQSGKVCFTHNPANPTSSIFFQVEHCLSWGTQVANPLDPATFEQQGEIDYVGPCCNTFCPAADPHGHCSQACSGPPGSLDGREGPHAAPLPITNTQSLVRVQNLFTTAQPTCNDEFAITQTPAPRNGAGQIANFGAPAPAVVQGETLFFRESFLGNGRACVACHNPTAGFGLNPQTVIDLFNQDPNDPLFIAENDPNLADLEDPCLMRQSGRALILENVHGFPANPAFRASPHLMNVADTAPYGWSPQFGGASNLVDFCQGAVKQHFPKFLPRNFDVNAGPLSQRTATIEELTMMEAFQNTIRTTGVTPSRPQTVDNLTTAAIACGGNAAMINSGRALFEGSAQCITCHNGNVLHAVFDQQTGVVDDPANDDDGCAGGPFDPVQALPSEDTLCANDPNCFPPMAFNVMALVDIARVKERFFHGNEASDLRDAVDFYNSPAFRCSPAGQALGCANEPGCPDAHSGTGCLVDMTSQEVDDITAFLEALVEPCIGACCLPNGSCIDVNPLDCNAQNGEFHNGADCTNPPCDPGGGACCLENGTCEQTENEEECLALCGVFQGEGSDCEGTICLASIPGACCLGDDSCVHTQGECSCEQQGGEFQGPGTNCAYEPCVEVGACCVPEGGCFFLTASECAAECGEFFGPGSSCPFVCLPEPLGACCLDTGACVDTHGACRCEQQGGDFNSGTTCQYFDCPQPGACCLPDGTCKVILEADCMAECGIFDGEGTVCGEECCIELPRACCLPDGTCIEAITCECEAAGGVSQPAGTACSDEICPQPGACCLPDGTCKELFEEECEALCGIFTGTGNSCEPVASRNFLGPFGGPVIIDFICPIEFGQGCCLPNGDCVVTTACLCEQQGGTPQGPFSNCAADICPQPVGRCCLLNGDCKELTENECAEMCGFFAGLGTNCDEPCPIIDLAPVACCLPDGTCTQTPGKCVCEQQGGTPHGEFVPCEEVACPQPIGRCCLDNGTCIVTRKDDCEAACGIFGGANTACTGICPLIPRGACCLPDGPCKRLTKCACESAGGTFHGNNTTCATTPCLIGPVAEDAN